MSSNIKNIDFSDYSGFICEKFSKDIEPVLKDIIFHENQDLIYAVRNKIWVKDVLISGIKEKVCVKSFKYPGKIKAFFYSYGKSKALRSFEHSVFLYENGVGVPEPVAFLEKKDLSESYFITRYYEGFSDLKKEMVNLLRNEPDTEKFLNLLKVTAIEIKKMHDSGFVHNDMGYQNIMIKRENSYNWNNLMFIDLNRGRKKESLTLKDRAGDIAKLEIPSDFLRVFFYMYFEDKVVPDEFLKWERKIRNRITFHNESRKYRHPIRHIISKFKVDNINDFTERPHYKDMWLWDYKSGQPAVMLQGYDRKKYKSKLDIFKILRSCFLKAYSIRKNYKDIKKTVFQKEQNILDKTGVCIEVDELIEKRLELLYEIPKIPVFIRVYFHKGVKGIEKTHKVIKKLRENGYEVSIGLVQNRESINNPEKWIKFIEKVLELNNKYIKYCEVGHAVNRVKWGIWTLNEFKNMWKASLPVLKKYSDVQYIGTAVNDFEYHFLVVTLDIIKSFSLSGVSVHLYVDRRGAPENFQGDFSTLEKCIFGKAIACSGKNTENNFFITETNWPLKGQDVYSPIGCPYVAPGITENPLHVDEFTYASYMIRYYLITLCSGTVERVFWWRLSAKGYGMVDDVNGFKKRIAFTYFRKFVNLIEDFSFSGKVEKKEDLYVYNFKNNGCSLDIIYTMKNKEISMFDKLISFSEESIEKGQNMMKDEIYYRKY